MSIIQEFITRIRRRKPPIIQTAYGNVTEAARLQASRNMAANPELRDNVFKVVLAECSGDEAAARKEFNRRYPEARYRD